MFQNLMTNRIRRARFPALILAIFLLQPLQLFAHAQGEHYVWIGVEETALNGEVEISSADLNALLGFDIDPTRKITEEALERYKGDLLNYFQERFAIEDSGGVKDTIEWTGTVADSVPNQASGSCSVEVVKPKGKK